MIASLFKKTKIDIKVCELHQQGKQLHIVARRNNQRIQRTYLDQSLYARRRHIWLELGIQVRKHRRRCIHR